MEVIRDILAILGGGGVIIFGLSKFLGKVWENRIKEKERKNTESELEVQRQNFGVQRVQADRFANSQYDIYVDLWSVIQGLSLSVDALWSNATPQNITSLASSLRETIEKVNNWSLFFEESDLQEIQRLLSILKKFEAGKRGLVNIRSNGEVGNWITEEIENQIAENLKYREEFESMTDRLRISFKKKLSMINNLKKA